VRVRVTDPLWLPRSARPEAFKTWGGRWRRTVGRVRSSAHQRGATRIHESDRVRLGTDSTCQILGNQKIYGLWGLYSVSARASGLLDGDPPRLTASAHDLVQHVYLPIFAEAGLRDARSIVELLRSQDARLDLQERSKNSIILATVARVLKNLRARERDTYREHLLYGCATRICGDTLNREPGVTVFRSFRSSTGSPGTQLGRTGTRTAEIVVTIRRSVDTDRVSRSTDRISGSAIRP
jgi:hypothetical protein